MSNEIGSPEIISFEYNSIPCNPNEAPVRKLIHELFAQHKRKRTVAKILTDQGYRTRRGDSFSDVSIDRMLRDPIVKGMRRVNYTESTGEKKGWKLKPKEDWMFIEVPRIISDELWKNCNAILDDMAKSGKVRRKGVHLFSSILECHCGSKMYMRSNYPKYICPECKNKIGPDDLEAIFHEQLKNFLFSDTEIQNHLNQEKLSILDKEELLQTRKKEYQILKQKVSDVMDLYHKGGMSIEAFKDHHTPLYEKQKQVELSMMDIQGEIDELKMQSLDNTQVLHDARNLQTQWKSFSSEEKKNIIETITKSIKVGKEDIEINLAYIPSHLPGGQKTINESKDLHNQINAIMQRTLRVAFKFTTWKYHVQSPFITPIKLSGSNKLPIAIKCGFKRSSLLYIKGVSISASITLPPASSSTHCAAAVSHSIVGP